MLATLITEKKLRALAGEKSFQRGAAYFAAGAVVALVDAGEVVKSRVVGTDEYKVTLKVDGKALDYACTCPVGEDGEFCKHAVAAGLAWLAQRRGDAVAPGYADKEEIAAIRDYVARLDRAALIDLVMEQVAEDEGLRSQLSVRAVRGGADADPRALKETVRKALAVHGFVDWDGMRRLLERARPVAELLRGLIAEGRAAIAAELADYAMHRGLSTYERIDDSAGSFGDLLREIAALHLEACRKARPDPEALGRALFALQLRDQWEFFDRSKYAPLLGDAGRKAYRALAEKEWAMVPARGPGGGERSGTESYFMIAHIMAGLARERGDIDALVAIKSRDLGHGHAYLEIAQILAGAGRREEALAWAERGRAAFRKELDWPLVEFLAAEYRRRKRFEDAASLAWEQFSEYPGLRAYQLLKTCADAGKRWSSWRQKALAWLREDLPKAQQRRAGRPPWMPGGHSLLVEIFLWEGDSDAALAEAKTGGCTAELWLALAKAREKEHPADAAAIYRQRLDDIVDRKNNDVYDRGAELIVRVRDLMRRAKQESQFAAWLDDVRARHKAKRNFMKRLEPIV
jgi:uncharacterized Zn finger protein